MNHRRFFIILACLCSFQLSAYQYQLSIAAIFQNEGPYLKEWIEYHKLVGVEHFYLYNNDSQDNFQQVLQPYIDAGEVELSYWPDLWPDIHFAYGCQAYAYQDALARSQGITEWLALIDLDEFILPMTTDSIPAILHDIYQNAPAIHVNWLQFGTSNISVPAGEPTIAHLLKCAKRGNLWNNFGKSIVRPELIAECHDPHFCILIDKQLNYYNGDGNIRQDQLHHARYLRINHYTFRDEKYFKNVKIPRCVKWNFVPQEIYNKNKLFNSSKNEDILRFVPSLKSRLNP